MHSCVHTVEALPTQRNKKHNKQNKPKMLKPQSSIILSNSQQLFIRKDRQTAKCHQTLTISSIGPSLALGPTP